MPVRDCPLRNGIPVRPLQSEAREVNVVAVAPAADSADTGPRDWYQWRSRRARRAAQQLHTGRHVDKRERAHVQVEVGRQIHGLAVLADRAGQVARPFEGAAEDGYDRWR